MADNNQEKEYPLVTKDGKQYRELANELGEVLREYPNGTIYNMSKKRLEHGASNSLTSASARVLASNRWERARKNIEAGAISAVPSAKGSSDAQKALGRSLMSKALDGKSAQSVSAAEKVSEYAGWTRTKFDRNDAPPVGVVRLTLDASMGIRELRQKIADSYGFQSDENAEIPKPHLPDLSVLEGSFKPSEEKDGKQSTQNTESK